MNLNPRNGGLASKIERSNKEASSDAKYSRGFLYFATAPYFMDTAVHFQ